VSHPAAKFLLATFLLWIAAAKANLKRITLELGDKKS
jgi:hypothetical protein